VREVFAHRLDERLREHRHAVLRALALSHHELVTVEVDVLHAQLQAFRKPQSRAIEQARHQSMDAGHVAE
jgi:hypothetical protein